MTSLKKIKMEGKSVSIPMARRNILPETESEEFYPSLRFCDDYKTTMVSSRMPDGSSKILYNEESSGSVSNGQVVESQEGQGNQVEDGPSGGGVDEISGTETEESDSQTYDEELYGGATRMSFDPILLSAYPKLEDILYEISCTTCYKAVGPPKISCAYGHLICESCFDELEENDPICKTQIGDQESSGPCEGRYYEINATIQNTPYFKYFLEVSQYDCFAKSLGCEVSLSAKDIDHHEKRECPYRFVKYCGYRNRPGEDNCQETFDGWAAHIRHMIEAHRVPVYLNERGHFMVRYEREEFMNTDDTELDVSPLVRAVHGEENRDFLIVLMVKELGNRQTRVWLLDARADNVAERKKRYIASICIHPVKDQYDSDDKDWMLKSIHADLAVVPRINMLVNLENTPKDEDGCAYYLDVDNEALDGIREDRNGEKYFTIMTEISVKVAVNFPPVEANVVEEMDVDGMERRDDVDGRSGSVEAVNVVAAEMNGDDNMEGQD